AMFENMIDIMFKDEYEVYVFDTAPTANAKRLLGMSSVYTLWINKMLKSREEAKSLKELLSYSKKKEKDPLLDYLIDFQDRIKHAKQLLTDAEKTAFFFITLPEALPIAVIKRFIQWFKEFGIPVVGIVVNMLIEKATVTEDSPDFVKNRVKMQDEYMDEIWKSFPDVRGIVPLFETEIRGTKMLERAAEKLFA
ncbi:MAG: arsenic transporter, partial [Actinomycetia bacterium]|nr:arsenic transporter [Actinomycetes bacterium]